MQIQGRLYQAFTTVDENNINRQYGLFVDKNLQVKDIREILGLEKVGKTKKPIISLERNEEAHYLLNKVTGQPAEIALDNLYYILNYE